MARMLNYAYMTTFEYIDCMPKEKRKKHGQFFTSKETAVFMADLFTIPQNDRSIRILDPGAGSGVLAIALLERIEQIETIDSVELVCYENDANILALLEKNLKWACAHSEKKVSYRIIDDNYILCQNLAYNGLVETNQTTDQFDMVIGNPPYRKLVSASKEAAAMPDICYGAPNMYFLFAAMSMFNLKPGGEMVYIIPRSWTSGAYFQKFRKKFFKEAVLEHIHLFVSRDKVFERESVLQETMIIKAKKTQKKPAVISITTSQNYSDFARKTMFEAPYSAVVSDNMSYVFLATKPEDVQVLDRLNCWVNTLPDIGLKMKTGLTVDFRHKEDLRDFDEVDTVPLFYAQHIRDGVVTFPTGKEHEYLATRKIGLLQENTNYLFVKRFTAKEEHRRLQCGVYLAGSHPNYEKISTQNKINFICGTKNLSECTVYGLYVLFNSTPYDSYYRILNGSTQVNSTEINMMPVPPLDVIEAMGRDLIQLKNMSEESCNSILRSYMPIIPPSTGEKVEEGRLKV